MSSAAAVLDPSPVEFKRSFSKSSDIDPCDFPPSLFTTQYRPPPPRDNLKMNTVLSSEDFSSILFHDELSSALLIDSEEKLMVGISKPFLN